MKFVHYNEISFSVYFTIAAGVKKTVHYTEDFVIYRFVISRFYVYRIMTAYTAKLCRRCVHPI